MRGRGGEGRGGREGRGGEGRGGELDVVNVYLQQRRAVVEATGQGKTAGEGEGREGGEGRGGEGSWTW